MCGSPNSGCVVAVTLGVLWHGTSSLSLQIAELERQLQMEEDQKEEVLGEVRVGNSHKRVVTIALNGWWGVRSASLLY